MKLVLSSRRRCLYLIFIPALLMVALQSSTLTSVIVSPEHADAHLPVVVALTEDTTLVGERKVKRHGVFDSPRERATSWLASTEPWVNVTTMGFWKRNFFSGFRNQAMAFSAFVMWARHEGHEQILLETLKNKDTFGSDRMMPFSYLFDVEHWNTLYPQVPRLASCKHPYTSVTFDDFNCSSRTWIVNTMDEAKNPYAAGEKSPVLFAKYLAYLKGKGPLAAENGQRNPIDLAILKGALQPNPDVRQVMNEILYKATGGQPYFTLHARVEPDMMRHPLCPKQKVKRLQHIVEMLEEKFPIPPAPKLFLPINRAILEKEARKMNKQNKKNSIILKNLKTLNRIVQTGLWNGTVQVFELGSTALNTTKYASFPSTIGAMMNFYLALESTLFIGTPVSTWSVDVTASRFYGGQRGSNYQYLPSGIKAWTSNRTNAPPIFRC